MGNAQSNTLGQTSPARREQISEGEDDDEILPRQRVTQSSQPINITPARQRASIYGSIRRRVSSYNPSTPPISQMSPSRISSDMDIDQDDSPLVHEGIQPIQEDTSMTTSTQAITRSLSSASRLGSRLMPESVRNTLWSSGEETEQEGLALRNGAFVRQRSTAVPRPNPLPIAARFSIMSSIRRRMGERSDSRIDLRRRNIRGPFPIGAHHELLRQEASLDLTRTEPLNTPMHDMPPLRRPTRLRRVRASLTAPFSSLLPPSATRSASRQIDRTSTNRPSRVTFADDSDHLLPPLTTMEHRIDMDDSPQELDAVESEARNIQHTPTITSGMSTIRRFPHTLRSRSTRLIRRGEYPPLSQVLQLAAAAIAAQLSGHTTPGTSTGRPFAGDMFDGSIQNFVQTLQEAASAQAGESLDVNASEGELPPVNFMRVFQFPNDEHGSPIPSQAQSRNVDASEIDQITNQQETDRSVTLVLVGVRSMPNSADTPGDQGHIGPGLDNLLSLPFLPQSNLLASGSSGALFRRPDLRNRTHTRRHSMTNFNFPAQYESQRHQRTRTTGSRLSSDPLYSPGNTITPLSESPPGPHPPPSTPADIRSGAATPIRRPSSASGAHGTALPDLEEDQVESPAELPSDASAYNVARQRRRSDSEFARRPELGSGAARRNGMVEPDNVASSAGRSWLIYVVGTNVSPDHPAFTMPSLFTDNPSYEDMQMLSTLLGPVKPPVATQDDVNSAGGLFRLRSHEGGVIAEGETAAGIDVKIGERCLICLCDYEAAEEVRQLHKCQHIFHRECIDEWLMTGRNSCPMCRGQGVNEKNPTTRPSSESANQVDPVV